MSEAMRSRRSSLALGTLLSLQLLAFGGCAHREVRYFQPSADQIGPDTNSYGEVVLPLHGLIAVQGDQLAYGSARGRTRHRINEAPSGQSGLTVSQVLRKAIRGVEVENRGYPDDTLAQSTARWSGSRAPNLLILCLGFGDASAHTPLDAFGVAFAKAIRAARTQGAAVFVVIPPQLSDPLENHELQDYRNAESTVAAQEGATVFNAAASMQRLARAPVRTAAQPAEVYQAIAADMAPYIKVVTATSASSGGRAPPL